MTSLRVGVVGVGLMGADHARRLATRIAGASLVALADPDVERAQALADELGGSGGTVRVHADPLDLVADEGVDAVLLASPGSVHEEQLLACIERGVHVLCEKPLTMNGDSSRRVVEAERAGGRDLVQVGFMRRFDPEYVRLHEMLADGRFGRPLVLHQTHRNLSVPNPDFRSEMIVRDSLVHEVDCARWLLGEEIVSVQVIGPTPTRHALDGVVDPQISIFRMASGAVVTNEVFVNSRTGYEVRVEAVGEDGSAIIGRPWGEVYTTTAGHDGAAGTWGGPIVPDYRVRFERAYDLEVQAWVDASLRGEVVGATSRDGWISTLVCSAGMESLASGRPVDVALP
ncbi:Gfo/Idh/MocA family oxidoreductase [Janibacter sp. FSL W8-0316]|uniref:Inositol 2-dehydrogenase n=1 Tax=Janibacter indicus TaxID=857417 RepID=A0A1L3MKM6_9MICO|nr:Gfo/Idh/MocA family oxidoreductase [Janibacter indicus]APH02860.1 inositol 2-dehydrogenase [Janibacter indicus]